MSFGLLIYLDLFRQRTTTAMKAPIYTATRLDDYATVYIVGEPNGEDRVWVCVTLDDARREKGRSDFAVDYYISENHIEA